MERQKKAFRKLKEWFTKELVLAALDIDKKMRMEVDVLDYAMEGSIINRMQRWIVEASSISLKIIK